MKTTKKMKSNKQKMVKKPIVIPKKEKVLIVAQEVKFARLLAGNDKTTRDRVLRTLKKWLLNCFQKGYEFKEDDFIRVWKGLFYAVWMSDKPLVQEELCENIAGILDQFPPEHVAHAIMMVKAGLRVLATEWYGIDHHRLDKFLMLVRRYLRGGLRCLLRCDWNLKSCQMFSEMLSANDGILSLKTPHYARNSTSMVLHFVDCFLEELAKVSIGSVPEASLVSLLRPFCSYVCGGGVPAVCAAARRLLTALLRQSDAGLRYQHKTAAWKMMGCPRGGPDALELQSDDDDDDETQEDNGLVSDDDQSEKPLDPRAGHVDVELPCLPVPANKLANMLREMLAGATSKAYRRTKICLERFEQLAKDEYPLPVSEVYEEEEEPPSWRPTRAAKHLRSVERQLVAEADELALRGLSRKHRKRLLAKSRAGGSILEDVLQQTSRPQNTCTNGDWKVEATDTEKDSSNKENIHKNNKKRKIDTHNSSVNIKKQKTIEKNAVNNKINEDKIKRDSDSGVSEKKIKKLAKTSLIEKAKLKKLKQKNDKTKHGFEEKSAKNVIKNKSNNKIDVLRSKNKDSKVNNSLVEIGSEGEKSTNKQEKVLENSSKVEKPINKQAKIQENNSKVDKAVGKHEKVLQKDSKVEKTANKEQKILQNGNKVEKVMNKQEKSIVNDNRVEKSTNKQSAVVNGSDETVEKKAGTTKQNNRKLIMMKSRSFEKLTSPSEKKTSISQKKIYTTPKKVKFVLKNNSMQGPVDYYKSVRQSPSIPYDSTKTPVKTNLKPSTPSPINPFFKKKWKLRK